MINSFLKYILNYLKNYLKDESTNCECNKGINQQDLWKVYTNEKKIIFLNNYYKIEIYNGISKNIKTSQNIKNEFTIHKFVEKKKFDLLFTN